jgi:uracil-DNA glycosylase
MSIKEKTKKLTEIAAKIADCQNCKFCEQRTKTVPGSGNPDADVLFIGEGPCKIG